MGDYMGLVVTGIAVVGMFGIVGLGMSFIISLLNRI